MPLKVQLCPAFFCLFLNKHSSSFLLCLLLPSWPHSIWDLSSPVRDRTCAPLRWKCRAGCWTTSEIPALYSCTETISRMYSSSAPGLSPPATHGLWAGSRFPHLPRAPTASCRTWRTGSSTHTCHIHQPTNWHSDASTDAPPRSSEPVAQVMLRPDSRPGLPTTPSQLRSNHLIP